MTQYESITPLNRFGSDARHPALGAPPGTTMPNQTAEFLRDLPGQLGLPQVGVSTPWAGRKSDMEWEEIFNPDTNVQTFLIRDEDLGRVHEVLFGHPIPFLVIKTLDPLPRAALEAALDGSAYEFFETQAVYRQDDSNPVPRIEFHHWIRRRPIEDEGRKSMDAVAAAAGGDLLYGQQVPVELTTVRSAPPSISFQEAFDQQFLPPTPAPGPAPSPVPGEPLPSPTDPEPEQPAPVPRSPAQMPIWGPLLVAGAVAAATVVVYRGVTRR